MATKIIPVNDPNIFYSPGNWYLNGAASATVNSGGGYMKIAFTGAQETVKLHFDLSGGSYYPIYCTLDGAPMQTVTFTSPSPNYIDFSALFGAPTWTHNHTLEAIFPGFGANDQFGSTIGYNYTGFATVTGLEVNNDGSETGVILPHPSLLSKRALIFGDSITAGSNFGTVGDGTLSYAWHLAQALSAECGQVGFPYQGWTVVGLGHVPPFFTPGNDAASSWNKLDGIAGHTRSFAGMDYIFVNHGTNDTIGDAAAIQASVAGWLAAVRGVSSATVFVVQPFGRQVAAPIAAGFAQYQSVTPDSKAFLIDLGAAGSLGLGLNSASIYSDDGRHPSQWRAGSLGGMAAVASALTLTPAPTPTPTPTQTTFLYPRQSDTIKHEVSGLWAVGDREFLPR